MARGRELSQLGSLIEIEDSTKNMGVGIATPSQKIGIGTLSPTSKVEVVGDVLVSGIITATSFVGINSGSVSFIDATETLTNKTLSSPVFQSGSNSPQFLEQRFVNANTVKFSQMYDGSDSGTYFTNGEYQKICTIIPDGDSQNYTFVARIIATSASSYQVVYFSGALRSNTLPDLSFTTNYYQEHNGTQFIEPKLFTKETSTAGFIIAFKYIHGSNLYGNITCDVDIIPRSSGQRDNITINTDQSSEQSSVDTGYTERDATLIYTNRSGTLEFGTQFRFEGATEDGFETTVTATDPTADRTITFPDSSGTVALVGGNTISEVSDDTTPQLGGSLDINGKDITGTGNINVSGVITATLFSGDGSGLTGVASTDNIQTATSANFLSNVNIAGITTCQALTVSGNLTVDGTTTTINSTTLTVDDKTIVIASGAADSSAADGAGISIDGASATILYSHSGTKFVSNKPFEATSFTGDVTGNVTGNTSGSSGSCTGNAATATTLQTARTIAGVSFDGSANISLNNNAITNGAGYITSSGTAALAQGLTGTPNINVGVITATSFSGDGSASFGGDINVGGYNGSSTTTDGVLLGASGGVFSQMTAATAGTGVLFQGMHGSTFTSRITAAGSAMFANDITLDRATAPSDVKISGSDTHAVWLSDGKFILKYDGSATFKGETVVQGTGKFFLKRNDAGATSCAIRDDNLRIFNNPVSYDDYKISLENDGSATFTGTVTANNNIQIQSDDSTPGRLDFYCESSNAHYTRLQSQAHANYSGNVTVTLPVVSGTVIVGGAVTNTSNINTTGDISATNFNSTSDVALKQDVSVIDNALEMISQLEGVSWKWKETLKPSLGVTAQNVEEVAPELVSNGSHKSVNYNGLIGILIEAVKELKSEVDELKR